MEITNKKKIGRDPITLLIVVLIYAVFSVLFYTGALNRQLTNLLVPVSCYIVLAISLNLVVGLLGELSLGHAGFMAAGLFSGCLLSIKLSSVLPVEVSLPIAMIFGGVFAAFVGFLVGLPALRLRGDYLAIVTLACNDIITSVITNLKVTGGALGLNTAAIYSKPKTLLPYATVLVILTVIVTMNLKHSKFGRAIQAIRDNRIAAEATGVNVTYYKLLVFMLAAFFAGMAGVLYGHNFSLTQAPAFNHNMSIEILVIVVLGGMGSVRGSIFAAIILKILPELPMVRKYSDYRMLVYSILLIVIMIAKSSPKFKEFTDDIKDKIFGIFRKKTVKEEEK